MLLRIHFQDYYAFGSYIIALVLAINWPCRMKMETDVRTYYHEHRAIIVHNVKHVSNPKSVWAKRIALRFGVGRVLL